MPSDPKPRKRDRTAAHLSATAFALFEAHGFDAVSMEQIAAEAEVAKATLYTYFPVKEALLAHRFREDIAGGMRERAAALAAHAGFDARMRYLLRESAAWHAERRAYLPHYLRFLIGRMLQLDTRQQAIRTDSGGWEILAAMVQAAQAAGEVDARHAAEDIAWSLQYLLFAAMSAWLLDPGRDLAERFLAAFDLAMHGIATRPPAASPDAPTQASP